MKSRVVLTLSFFLFFNIIYCQKGSQLLEEIVTVFLANYNVPIPINNHVNFSKKGDQLYVVKKHDFFDQGVEEEFYDFKIKTFSSISLFEKKNPTIEKLQVENFSKEQLTSINIDINNFKKSSTIFRDADIYPFYGYEGFYNDAIKFYEDKSSLTSDQRYSLCRAYTYKVVNMLYDSYPNGMKSERIIVDQNDKIDKKSVDYYLREFSKERESYNRLKAEFPDFMTSTGNVVDKYGFIVMHSYVKLLYFGGEEIASQVLEKNLFTDSLISESREILDSCPKNSVLFTWGDKDTYPLYYLQGFNKYRTDVVLINLSLAVIPRYIKMITSGPYGSSPIKLSFPDKLLNGTKYISHDLNDQDGNIDNIEKYYKFLSENNFTNFGYGSSYIVVPSSSLKISLPDKCSGEYMEIKLSKYYFLAEVVQIDFLNSLIWERGIYFTKDCLEYINSPMKPYLVMKESLLTIDFSLFCK